jgi:acetyl esterase/lipase
VSAALLLAATMAQAILERTPPPYDRRVTYGGDPNQFYDIRGSGDRLVFVVHGGFWRAAYSLEHIGHLCAALSAKGVTTVNVEYRRIGQPGGGWPGTFEDVRAALRHARESLKPKRITVTGHSAGGHLVALLANEPGVDRVVPLAGVLDLRRAWELKLSRGVVGELLGTPPDDRFAEASPIERLPVKAQVVVAHGRKDSIVPIEIGESYAKRAKAKFVELPDAGHFELIDPQSKEWPLIERAILEPR